MVEDALSIAPCQAQVTLVAEPRRFGDAMLPDQGMGLMV